MKHLLNIIFFFGILSINAQSNLNLSNGFIAKGYDVVSYFNDSAKVGLDQFTYTHEGAKYKFTSKSNLDLFKSDPEKYTPQYGGYCAYAIAKDGSKVDINPKTYLIQNGKLLLFYNTWPVNTLKKWIKNNPIALQENADTNWKK